MTKTISCLKCKKDYFRHQIIRGACQNCYGVLYYSKKIGLLSEEKLNAILKPSKPSYLKACQTKKLKKEGVI